MDLKLDGRRALVAGASRGLGRAIALALAAEGVHVAALARNAARLDELARAAPQGRGALTTHICDLSDAEAIERLGIEVGPVDILIVNTGGPPPGEVSNTPDAVWLAQFEAMFLSAVRLTRLALPGMKERGFGRIISVVSSGVVQPIPNLGISNVLRLAVVGWAKTLASEVASSGITVNCITPGRIGTDRVDELDGSRAKREGVDVEEVRRQSRATIPVGRYGEPQEFAAAATFLASPLASYITGSTVRVDGGFIRSL